MTAILPRRDASTTVKGNVRLASAPDDAADPVAVGDNDPRVGAGHFDGDVVAEQSDALSGGDTNILVPGVLNDDLYVFSSGEAGASSAIGARILRLQKNASTWETLVTGLTQTFDGLADYGAVEFNGKLYCGSNAGGRIYELVIDTDGDYSGLNTKSLGAGTSWAVPGAVLWNKLWIGTTGGTGTGGPDLEYWDGSAGSSTNLIHDTTIGDDGWCSSMTVYNGRLWCSFTDDAGKCRIYAVGADLNAHLIYNATSGPDYLLHTWGDSLMAVSRDTGVLAVYQDGAFVTIASGLDAPETIAVAGDELFVFDSEGPHFYRYDGQFTDVDLGALSGTQHGLHGVTAWNGSVWWTTSATTASVLRLPIGTERTFKQISRPQTSQGGNEVGRRFVSDLDTKGMVLKSANGKYWRVTVGNTGTVTTADLGTTRPTS